jgi:hypothetical protein
MAGQVADKVWGQGKGRGKGTFDLLRKPECALSAVPLCGASSVAATGPLQRSCVPRRALNAQVFRLYGIDAANETPAGTSLDKTTPGQSQTRRRTTAAIAALASKSSTNLLDRQFRDNPLQCLNPLCAVDHCTATSTSLSMTLIATFLLRRTCSIPIVAGGCELLFHQWNGTGARAANGAMLAAMPVHMWARICPVKRHVAGEPRDEGASVVCAP